MLNPFPIQFLAPLAYFLLRVTLGVLCVRIGLRVLHTKNASTKRKIIGALFSGAGMLLVLGLFTQIAALLIAALTSLGLARKGEVLKLARTSLILMLVISISLFITGAGPFGFDLPI